MQAFLSKYKYYLLLSLLFFISELIVNPVADFPLNDDWTYGKSVWILNQEGQFDVGNFAAMTLFTHIMWGYLFVKAFGFSFTVLRVSILVSSLIGIFVLNKLVSTISKSKLTGFIACLVLLFNPLYFNLSNTFMTDVNFNTVLLLCCYFAYDFFKEKKTASFTLVFVMSTLLVLIRQYGIIVPLCFAFACLFITKKKWLYFMAAVLGMIVVYAVFKYYESYLKGILPQWASYKFSGQVNPGSQVFWDTLTNNWNMRYKQILQHVLIYVFPFTLIFSKDVIKSFRTLTVLLIFLLGFCAAYFLFKNEKFPFGNVFSNMSLGVETFYQTLSLESINYRFPTYAPDFENIMMLVKYCFSGAALSILILAIPRLIKSNMRIPQQKPEIIFLISLFCAYTFMILITESYFDRYHIPLITLSLILFSFLNVRFQINYKPALIVVAGMFYISVFGTKDYVELNRIRWEAYAYLKKENIPADKINGGFEVNCWNDGQRTWWSDFMNLEDFDYLIQYREHSGFRLYKSFEFQRYFPYEKDKVNIFVREGKEQK